MKQQTKKVITPSALKYERGWTDSMIRKLLSNVDYELVENPFYRKAAPMSLYSMKDITRIERTKKFKELKEKADRRRVSSKKAIETKTKNTIALSDDLSIEVERIEIDELREITLEEKQYWYIELNIRDGGDRSAYSAPKDDVDRWMVNFIRHNLSNYDEELERISGKVGVRQGYWHYKEKLAEEMKKAYEMGKALA